jgi:hypothetical protein
MGLIGPQPIPMPELPAWGYIIGILVAGAAVIWLMWQNRPERPTPPPVLLTWYEHYLVTERYRRGWRHRNRRRFWRSERGHNRWT